ncbi:DUF3347 domain-containing protein [Pricia sp. S334]|uniref:DUF3347 domain-containing protein n=1 Tax=Pricia mediterranea TaxID=3076079 RepID=A0ABU3L1P7_9FLAO|nr:DUF3347 domain-containing protein [Pricia sp. S334]MDT7827124.1 DUF3347 domain-containing protein [Pricia sp. S334]
MKTRTMTFAAALTLALAVGCKENKTKKNVGIDTPKEVEQQKTETSDIADQGFVDGMTGKVWHNYLQLKMALVNSDSDAAQKAAGDMAESFDQERADMKSLAQQIADSDGLEEQRQLFSEFGEKVEDLFTEALSEGTIYKQYCPMAFDNEGAYWFSDVSEIRNPYFGDRMLKCGSVKEEIKG